MNMLNKLNVPFLDNDWIKCTMRGQIQNQSQVCKSLIFIKLVFLEKFSLVVVGGPEQPGQQAVKDGEMHFVY